jgi:hypothetical protein
MEKQEFSFVEKKEGREEEEEERKREGAEESEGLQTDPSFDDDSKKQELKGSIEHRRR